MTDKANAKDVKEHREIEYVSRKDALALALRGKFSGYTAATIVQRADVFREYLRDGKVPDDKIAGV